MNVLSLFDGLSGGRIALERAGIKVDNYFASEIDKYAIKISQHNYPDIVQLGDVTNWREWDLPKIDLLIGGSPCQGFSFAGKQLNFDDPRSKLFFEFVDILNHVKPKYFMLENVKMAKKVENVISEMLGVEPIKINSSLVSAQNRERLYWTNIQDVTQPKDKCIFLSDILEKKGDVIGASMRGRYINENQTKQFIELRKDDKANCLTTVTKNCLVVKNDEYVDRNKSYCIDANYFKGGNLKSYFEKSRRQLVFESEEEYKKAVNGENHVSFRKLTPLECERLQTLPEHYTACVSNTQRYKAIGNGWTIDVIAHILGGLK